MDIKLDAFYTTEWGDFQIKEGRFLFNSYDREGKALVCGATAKAVFDITPMHLMNRKLGLKEERGYDATVGGKL